MFATSFPLPLVLLILNSTSDPLVVADKRDLFLLGNQADAVIQWKFWEVSGILI